MLTLLFISAIIMTYLIVGHVAVHASAKILATKHACVSVRTHEWAGKPEYSCRGKVEWLEEGRTPNYFSLYTKTGRYRGENGVPTINRKGFTRDANLLRWLWFVMLPAFIVKHDTDGLVAKHDPAELKRRQDEADARQIALTKKTAELEAREDALREAEEKEFDKRFKKAVELR